MDKIIINNLHIFAYHGVNEEEKINGQNFYLDIICGVDLTAACLTDSLDDTVSYAKIIKTVKMVFGDKLFKFFFKKCFFNLQFPSLVAILLFVEKIIFK